METWDGHVLGEEPGQSPDRACGGVIMVMAGVIMVMAENRPDQECS